MWGWACLGRTLMWLLTKEGHLEQETHEKPSPRTCPPVLGSSGIMDGSATFAYMESESQPSIPCPVGTCMVWEQGWCGVASGPFL